MSLGHSLLESGVEMELRAEMQDVIALLDSEVPRFSHEGYGYRITSVKGVLDTQCTLLMKPWDRQANTQINQGIGLLEMNRLDEERLSCRLSRWTEEDVAPLEDEEAMFASLVFQLVHVFQSNGLMDPPGPTPAR